MNATSLYLRQLNSASREINYGNMVLVQRDTGEWWLGYVQDIDGDEFFVDFDASTMRAQWIHTSHLWPHHFLRKPVDGASIQAALREEDGGPMVFRSGTIADCLYAMFSAVRLNNPASSCIVHRSRIVERLPTPKDPSFAAHPTSFVYTKYVVDFGQAHLLRDVDFLPIYLAVLAHVCRVRLGGGDIRCERTCSGGTTDSMDRITFHCSCSGTMRLYEFHVGCRAFVRVGLETVTFICAEVHGDTAGRMRFWSPKILKKACRRYLALQQACVTDRHSSEDRLIQSSQLGMDEMCMDDLPLPVTAAVLLDMDVSVQFCMSRVCKLWRLVLREYGAKRHMIFDMRKIIVHRKWDTPESPGPIQLNYLNLYKLAAMLNGHITQHARSLVFIDEKQHSDDHIEFIYRCLLIKKILDAEGIRLRLIIAKNGYDCVIPDSSFLALVPIGTTENYKCDVVRLLLTVCETLVLINFTASDRCGYYSRVNMFRQQIGPRWPESGMTMVRIEAGQLDVVVPFLRFCSGETAVEQCRRFLAAVNDNCLAVSPKLYEKVTTAHARWVQTLAYPDEWTDIRRFLQLYGLKYLSTIAF